MHALNDFILHISDVHHVNWRKTLMFEVAPNQIGKDKCAEIADMGEVVDCWAAAVHANCFAGRVERRESLHRSSQCIEKSHDNGNKPCADYALNLNEQKSKMVSDFNKVI